MFNELAPFCVLCVGRRRRVGDGFAWSWRHLIKSLRVGSPHGVVDVQSHDFRETRRWNLAIATLAPFVSQLALRNFHAVATTLEGSH